MSSIFFNVYYATLDNTEETNARWFKGGLFDVNQETKNANCELCAICSKKGYISLHYWIENRELLMCDGGCRRSFHFACVNMKVYTLTVIKIERRCSWR